MTDHIDNELEALLHDDADLMQTARLLTAARPQPAVDERFKAVLRARLMKEAPQALKPRIGFFQLRRGLLAWGSAGLGAAAVAAAVMVLVLNQAHSTTNYVAATSPLSGNTHVDPNQAIQVAFSQPMDETSVVQALRIQPATAFKTSWTDNTLTITPDHALASNVPYVVTIDHSTAKSADGIFLQADVTVTFGTAPTPTPSLVPTPTTPPALVPTQVGPTDGDVVTFAQDGSLIANGSPSTLTSASPRSSGSASPSATAFTSPTPSADGLYKYPSGGGSLHLASRALAASTSPDGKHIAVAVKNGNSGSMVEVVRIDGTHLTSLATTSTLVVDVAWSSNSTVVYATGQTVSSVGLDKQGASLGNATTGDQFTALSPGGQYAAEIPIPMGSDSNAGSPTVAPTSGALLTLKGSIVRALSGSTQNIAFSADGNWVAWVDSSGTNPQLTVSPANSDAPSVVPLVDVSVGAAGPIAINHDGTLVAVMTNSNRPTLDIVSAATGSLIATGDSNISHLAFDLGDDHLAYTTLGSLSTLNVVVVPSSGGSTQLSSNIPAAATDTLNQFVTAQTSRMMPSLSNLVSDGVSVPNTPGGVTRGNVVDVALNDDGTVTAHIVLIADPSGSRTLGSSANETLILSSTGNAPSFKVSSLTLGPLNAILPGPHIIALTASRTNTEFVVTFDSDLNASTVQSSISLTDSSGNPSPLSVHYDVNTRTATITVLGPPATRATLTVSTSLGDVAGQHLAQPYSYTAHG